MDKNTNNKKEFYWNKLFSSNKEEKEEAIERFKQGFQKLVRTMNT